MKLSNERLEAMAKIVVDGKLPSCLAQLATKLLLNTSRSATVAKTSG
jgi:hypothetical protein